MGQIGELWFLTEIYCGRQHHATLDHHGSTAHIFDLFTPNNFVKLIQVGAQLLHAHGSHRLQTGSNVLHNYSSPPLRMRRASFISFTCTIMILSHHCGWLVSACTRIVARFACMAQRFTSSKSFTRNACTHEHTPWSSSFGHSGRHNWLAFQSKALACGHMHLLRRRGAVLRLLCFAIVPPLMLD